MNNNANDDQLRVRGLCLTMIALLMTTALVANGQHPTLPEPRVAPKKPSQVELPRRPSSTHSKAQVTTTVNARINPQARAKFDIHVLKLHGLVLDTPRLRGRMLRAKALNLDIVLANRGTNTFAFAGNQIDASLIEGHFDYRQRVNVNRQGIPYYPARGLYDIVARAGNSVEVPLVIRGQKTRKQGLWPVPLPNRWGAGLRAVEISSGNAPIEVKPEVWYTIEARLTPANDDQIEDEHAVFVNVRFGSDGTVAEQQGPYTY